MKPLIGLLAIGCLLLISACNWLDNSELNIDYSDLQMSKVKDSPLTGKSESQVGELIKNGIRLRLAGQWRGGAVVDASAAGDSASSGFSTTNVHELGVDEADRLKYDGNYLYTVSSRWLESDAITGNSDQPTSNKIRILETSKEEATATQVSTIEGDNQDVQFSELYLLPELDLLVSIANTQFYYWSSQLIDDDWAWNNGKTQIQIYDVADPRAPAEQFKLEIEGNLQGSRRIGDILYLVTRSVPNIEGLDYAAQTKNEKQHNEAKIRSTPISDLLPHYQTNDGAIRSLVSTEDCLVTENTADNEGYADIIAFTAINLSSRNIESSVCINANVHGIYSSTSGFYLGGTSSEGWMNFSNLTAIHKFNIDAGNISYRASAALPGYLGWSDPAFRMSELNDDLRIITTDFNWDNPAGPEHLLSILREDGTSRLKTIATLPNESSPSPIGKPGENIFAVRFVEERAYVVTFEQIDPLYVIDLSVPESPQIAGEIEIPGFSRYLHPLGEGWLLGIGNEVEAGLTQGIKLELYDIRDISTPKIKNTILLGERYSRSEATYDLRSFSLLDIDDDTKRLAFPADIWSKNLATGQNAWQESGLFLFDINGVADNEMSLNFAGKMITEINDGAHYYPTLSGVGRSRIHGDSIFYLHGNDIWSTHWGDWLPLNGPY